MPGVMRRRPMRLLMTADAVGGVWQYATDLARGLADHQIETTLAILGPAPTAQALERALAIPGLRVVITGLRLDWTAESPAEVAQAGRALADLARSERADLVHLNSPALAAEARFHVPVVGICHSCVATWWQAVRGGPLPQDFVWRTRLLARGYGRADALTAPTAAFARMTANVYGMGAPHVVHNGRRARALSSAAESAAFVFTAGRLWDDGKNLAALDRAAARLNFPVIAAGPLAGPNGAAIAFPNLRTLGRLDDEEIDEWLAQRPIFASVPRYEPFGLAVLEAAQAGCALLLSDIPTLRELWDGAALFVDPDDCDAIASAIQTISDDGARRDAFGAAARERSRAYTVEAMAAGMRGIYDSVLAREAARPREAVA
ncbi:MAG TPA: glycosyltransferase family 4 protein [Beijerinckiaceae bacterium]|nr:glycosyltransferase family 4 protein [Beijerinckiaceae bacterium]